MTTATSLLSVEDLGVDFRIDGAWHRAVEGVDLQLSPGETLGLVGESGSGKSVTSLAVMRLLPRGGRISNGRMLLDGEDLAQVSWSRMRAVRGGEIGMIFQDPVNSLDPAFTVGDQLVEAIRAHEDVGRRAALDRAVDLLDRVGIADARRRVAEYPHQFSGGMAQRVMIAMAISARPRILIADEPTTALDVTIQAQILELLRSLQDEYGMALLLISHDLSVVAEMADRVTIMYAGQVVEEGPVTGVLERPSHPYTEALLSAQPDRLGPGQRLTAIRGTVPGITEYPTGCRFRDRCDHALDACAHEVPLVPHPGGRVRCARFGELELRPGAQGRQEARPAIGAGDGSALLSVEDVTVEFAPRSRWLGKAPDPFRAVDGVSFDIHPGETVGLVGESGAGKTTMGRVVLGLVSPSSGRVAFGEDDLTTASRSRWRSLRQQIQVVFQNPYASLDPRMRVGDSIAEPLDVHRHPTAGERRRRIGDLLERVGLQDACADRLPHELSGGQRQRVAIARALALEPRLIVCDEPVSALDVSTQAQVLNLLRDLQRDTGCAYLFVGHDLAVVRYMSHRVAVMQEGRIVEMGPADRVYDTPQHPYTKQLLGAVLSSDPRRRQIGRRPTSQDAAAPSPSADAPTP